MRNCSYLKNTKCNDKFYFFSVGDEAEFTAVTYTDTGMVYIGTSTGYVTLWDPRSTACILHWSAHPQEIDMLWYQNSSLLSG